MTKRRWKEIAGYEGRYQISDDGLVRSLISGIVMKQQMHPKGYRVVSLTIAAGKGKKDHRLVHQLVAEQFVKGKAPGLIPNHKDGDKTNNHYRNLEWMTHSENHKHAYRVLGRRIAHGGLRDSSRPCRATIAGFEFGRYPSARAAANELGLNEKCVSRVCRGERTATQGFSFEYL